jgi:acyl-homoserine-lactone acylase
MLTTGWMTKMNNKKKSLLSIVLLMGLSACNSDSNKNTPPPTTQPTPDVPTLVAFDNDGSLTANIRRTTYGVPHITGENLQSVGFGSGYAYAQDNICILADQIVKVRSERAKYFGADKVAGSGDTGNIISDFGHHALGVMKSAEELYPSMSENSRALIEGYITGYNKYLTDTGIDNLAPQCVGQPWVKPITAIEMTAYLFATSQYASGANSTFMQLAFLANPGATDEYLPYVGAKSKSVNQLVASAQTKILTKQLALKAKSFGTTEVHLGDLGSNGWGIGKDKTENGKGIILANPHFPHTGHLKFYQSHVTIPGVMDVMGGALQGFPVQNIGFNKNLGWTHTVSKSRRFVVYKLDLVQNNALQYTVDEEVKGITKKTYFVEVNAGGGSSVVLSKDYYYSHHGLMIETPASNGMAWSEANAFTLRDSAEKNIDMIDHWLAMNLATNLTEFQQAFKDYNGIPWVNTMYADDEGNAFYIDKSRVHNLNDTALGLMRTDPTLLGTRQLVGFDILPGNTALFEPDGLNSYEQAPKLLNSNYVQNSNDSYWFTNPSTPLSAYSILYGDDFSQLSLRTRMSLKLLNDSAGADDKFNSAEVESALFSNRAYLAEAVMSDLLTQCQAQGTTPVAIDNGMLIDISTACIALANWDMRYNKESTAAHVFREFAYKFTQSRHFSIPFNSDIAASTPNTLVEDGSALKALAMAIKNVETSGFTLDAMLGELQFTEKTKADGFASGERFPWAGAKHQEGGFNIFASAKSDDTLYPIHQYTPVNDVETGTELLSGLTTNGYHLNYGSSWMFVVNFTDNGPNARGLLSYSQSSNTESEHHDDQNRYYSQKTSLRPILFNDADISSNIISEVDITSK